MTFLPESETFAKLTSLKESIASHSGGASNGPPPLQLAAAFNNIREAILIDRPQLHRMVPRPFPILKSWMPTYADLLARCDQMIEILKKERSGG